MADSLERIYRAVPTVQCKGLCQQSCGPINMSAEERRRIVVDEGARALIGRSLRLDVIR